MDILSDNPSKIKEVVGENISVKYSPALDVYTKKNQILRTLKGMYFSSKLDLTNQDIINYIRDTAKPADLPEPRCHTCYNYADFDNFCKEYIDNAKDEIRVAYDVETTAAPYLSSRYKLAGFSLATKVSDGCYVILDSLDYENPDKEAIIKRLGDIIKSHNMLVFNAQHEYIATNICVDIDIAKESKHLDDVYSMSLLLKTESFKADVFKLKLLCNRLLGLDNWATIIDDYIDLATEIASDDVYDFKELTDEQKEKISAFCDMLRSYNYTDKDIVTFIKKLQSSYSEWKDQDIIPYSLIPSNMIAIYGCYDSCYLLALYDYFMDWAKELEEKLANSMNKIDIKTAYEETIAGQIMSAILTLNGIFVSEERDNEVKAKSQVLAEKHYNKLWDIKSDTSGEFILREYAKAKFKPIVEKNYLLPLYLVDLIPEGFKFVKTTPSFYSFECEVKDIDKIARGYKDYKGNITEDSCLVEDNTVKVYKDKQGKPLCKLLQKHLLPFDSLQNEDKLIEEELNKFLNESKEKDGSLSVNIFKPMSGPSELYEILTRDLKYAKFLSRVVLFEYHNLPDKLKSADMDKFFDEHLLYDFNSDIDLYVSKARQVYNTVMDYLKKSYPHKEIYENLLKDGIHSFSSPIIEYIYNIFTATGCSVAEPVYSAFDFICQLKICRKYLRIMSTFIKGNSGGYASQMKIKNSSIDKKFLELADTSVLDESGEPYYTEDTSSVVFGKWFASTADTGRWQATVHNVPAGPYCKRRFVSRYKGGFILTNDMSQAEVRELAAVSHCEPLLNVVSDPTVDIHRQTASLAFDVPYDEVSGTQRKQTKTGIFSIVYGRDEQSLAQELFKGDRVAAKRLMDAIFKVYPDIPEYLDAARAEVKDTGYLVTRRGCPIFVNPYTQSGNDKGEAAVLRACNNYSIQGGAAGFCTGTLVNVQKLLDKYNLRSKIICYIHDAVYLDCPPDELDAAINILNSAFNNIATKKYGLPTASDTEFGISMGSACGITRIEKYHYKIEGNNQDIIEAIEQLKLNYNVDILSDDVDEIQHLEDDVSWIFTQRAELRFFDIKQDREMEIKITPKNTN